MQCNGADCGESICSYGCFRVHERLVRNLVYHITRNANELDDIVQEIFLKVYQSLHAFRGGSFRAYLVQVARNHCYDWLRRQRTQRAWSYVELVAEMSPSSQESPEDIVIYHETAQEVAKLLDSLSDLDRVIMLLRHVHQFSYEEIAAAVGLKPGAVRTRVSRARQKLAESMERRSSVAPSRLG